MDIIAAATALRAGTLPASAFETVFRRATVFAERPLTPGLMVVDLGERGRWAPVFSSLDRLAAQAGECDLQLMSGADLLDLLPPATGVILDPRDPHTVALPARLLEQTQGNR